MTIERGEDWGSPGSLPADAPIAGSDQELARLWNPDEHRLVGLTGGDLHRTVGGRTTAAELRSDTERVRLPIDVGVLEYGDTSTVFVAHVVRRRRLWSGTTVALMNASFRDAWNVAPRGHPNDGRIDVVESGLSLGDRFKARSRLPSGLHVPHPQISIRRQTSGELLVQSGDRLEVDGETIAIDGRIQWRVVPDALTIVI